MRTTVSPVATSVSITPEDTVDTSAPAIVSPGAPKRLRMMPSLSTFQATKAAQLLHADSLAEAQVESGSSMPLTSREIVVSAAGGQSVSLADMISRQVSAPASIFDSPIGDFPVSRKEMPTTSAGGESTSAKDTTVSDTGEYSGNIAEDGARLFDDLYLPTMCWDPHAQDKRYQPKRKIAESSRLVFSPVVHH
ncbi:hypothetical protein Hanom_Chr06g00508691 [Helianthus anomalus]